MEIHFSSLNLDELQALYEKAEADLQKALLGGEPWSSIQTKREIVTKLAILLHRRKYPLGPSDN